MRSNPISLLLLAVGLIAGVPAVTAQTSYTLAEVSIPSATSASANGINNAGQMVGQYVDSAGATHGFFRDVNGQTSTIDIPGATLTVAYGIAGNGAIAGWYQSADGTMHGFLFTPTGGPVQIGNMLGTFTFINYPGAIAAVTNTQAYGVNSDLTVVGSYSVGGVMHGFQWTVGQFSSIDVPGATSTVIQAVNDTGETAGTYRVAGNGVSRAGAFFRSAGGNATTFAEVTGADPSISAGPVALNGLGQAITRSVSCGVGGASICTMDLVMRDRSGNLTAVNLANLAPSGYPLAASGLDPMVSGLNSAGTVVGSYRPNSIPTRRAFESATCGPVAVSTQSPLSYPGTGGSGTLAVTPTGSCIWSAGAAYWIGLNGVNSTTQYFAGPQTLNFQVLPNDTPSARTGNISAGGQIVTLSEDSGTCVYKLSSSFVNMGPQATTPTSPGVIQVQTASSCPWTATSNSDWITILNGSGSGFSQAVFSTTSNPSATDFRQGSITVAGQTITVEQQPSSVVASTFTPVTPCRIVDSRLPSTSKPVFGGPALGQGGSRDIDIPGSACHIPANATAYSLNLTVVPIGALNFATLWPTGQSRPNVSTLNSLDGRTLANAAIVPAGTNGSISIYATDPTNFVIDINGYFTAGTAGLGFSPAGPCRAVDTRQTPGPFGWPPLTVNAPSRDFALANSTCGIDAPAYVLNATVVPSGAVDFLTLSPTGTQRPTVSTLNSPSGDIVANMAIVPSGTNGSVNAFASLGAHASTDLVLDIFGYFSRTASGKFYALPPCRVADTRGNGFTGDFGTPSVNQGDTHIIPITSSPCGVPSNATAVSLNVTAVPQGPLYYLSVMPGNTSPAQPTSTLNSLGGRIVANAAIVPIFSNGAIQVQLAGATTDVVIDVNGYFAP